EDIQAALIGGDLICRAQSVEVIVEKTVGAFDKFVEGGATGVLDEAVGIMGSRNDSHADGQAGCEQMVERSDGGVLTGVIGIEAEDYLIDVALEGSGMLGGKGGALRGDHVLDPCHKTRDQIE